jgi:hypothetical protein
MPRVIPSRTEAEAATQAGDWKAAAERWYALFMADADRPADACAQAARAFLALPSGGYRPAGPPLALPTSVLSAEAGPETHPVVALTDDGLSEIRLNDASGGPTLTLEPLLDEPCAGVNPSLVDQLRELLVELNKVQGGSFVVIEHNMDFIMKLCPHVICMVEGKVLAEGPPAEVQANRHVLEAYLGN